MKHLCTVIILMIFTISGNSLASQDDKNSSSEQADARRMSGTPGTVQFTLSGHTAGVRTVAWNPDGTKILTSNYESVKIWSAETGALLTSIPIIDYTSNIYWSPDGTKIAGVTNDSTITIWSAANGNELRTLRAFETRVLSWSPDGTKIAVGSASEGTSREGIIDIWSVASGTVLLTLQKNRYVRVLRWSSDGSMLASGGVIVNIWSTVTGNLLWTVQNGGYVHDVDWSPDGTETASAQAATIIIASVVKVNFGDIKHWLAFEAGNEDVISVRWHPDGKRVLTTYSYGKACIWSTTSSTAFSYEPLVTFEKNGKRTSPEQVTPALWSPDYTKVLATAADSTAKVWSSATGALHLTLRAHTGNITAACWSPDGAKVATASDDSTVKVWYITDASGIQDSPTHTEAGFSLFPNPTDNSLHLSFATENAVSSAVQICDLLGRTVATADIPAGTKQWTMSVGNLPVGVYAVRWGGGVQKLVVR